jgi:hypothetical protein
MGTASAVLSTWHLSRLGGGRPPRNRGTAGRFNFNLILEGGAGVGLRGLWLLCSCEEGVGVRRPRPIVFELLLMCSYIFNGTMRPLLQNGGRGRGSGSPVWVLQVCGDQNHLARELEMQRHREGENAETWVCCSPF